MSEFYEDRLVDADIIIDYKNNSVIFENKEYLGDTVISIFKYFSLWSIPVILFMYFYDGGYGIVYTSLMVFMVFGIAFIFLLGMILINSSNNEFIRNMLFKFKSKNVKNRVNIENPGDTVIYTTLSLEPFIDIEYDPDVKDSLESVSLIKEKKNGIFFGKRQKRQVLTIKFFRRSIGNMTIIEY